MNIEQLTRKVEQGFIEKIAISKTPESAIFWFVYPLHRDTRLFEILKAESDGPLAFSTIDDAIHLISKCGFDGKIVVMWDDQEEMTCN